MRVYDSRMLLRVSLKHFNLIPPQQEETEMAIFVPNWIDANVIDPSEVFQGSLIRTRLGPFSVRSFTSALLQRHPNGSFCRPLRRKKNAPFFKRETLLFGTYFLSEICRERDKCLTRIWLLPRKERKEKQIAEILGRVRERFTPAVFFFFFYKKEVLY